MAGLDALAGDYLRQAQALLPAGLAWPRRPGAELTKLLSGLVREFARVDLRARELLVDAVPGSSVELLSEWEALCGLPRCEPVPESIEARQTALITHLRTTSAWSPTPEAIKSIAAEFGHPAVELEMYAPFVAGSPVGASLYQGGWYAVWRFSAPGPADTTLECSLRWLAPVHTVIHFNWE